ncbi:MAG: MFS transporter [Roseiflexaceae bacterium]|jgi:MFS family permease|nr:MFS transporter [Chloroflexaceae bacterium]MCE2853038.1 MFS transporter [Chloroflexaceae bacterium]
MQNSAVEARVEATPWSRPVIVLIVTQIVLGMREIPQSAFFLVYLQTAQLSPVSIATITSTAQVTGMLVAFAGGFLSARYGHKWVFLCGLLVTALNSLVFQLDTIWLITLLWSLGGAGSAVANIGSSSYLTALGRIPAMGLISALFVLSTTIGGTLGNPGASALITHYGYDVFGWVMLAIIVVMCGFIYALLPESAPPEPQAATVTIPTFALFRTPAILYIVLMRACATIFYGMVLVLVPLMLHTMTADINVVARYTSFTLIAASIVQFLAGRAADRWGGRLPTLVIFAIMVACGVCFGVLPHTMLVLTVLGVTSIACAWALSALMFVWIRDGVTPALHPPLFGMLYAVWSLSMIVGSIAGSWLYEQWPSSPFVLFGMLNTIACVAVMQFYRHGATEEQR